MTEDGSMDRIRKAIDWSGGGLVEFLMFVVATKHDLRLGMSPPGFRPLEVGVYVLEDEAVRLGGRYLIEFDGRFMQLPSDIPKYLTGCLMEAMMHGADAAWFAYEGSFNFEFLLDPELADQVYAIADAGGIAVATDSTIKSDAWRERVTEVRDRLSLGPWTLDPW